MGGWPGCVKLAEIVVCPAAAPLTNPVLLIVAKVGAEDDQLTWFVRSTVLPSLKVPVAVNCKVAPTASVGLTGVMVNFVIVALDTLIVVDPVIPANTAVMVLEPAPIPVARPSLWLALLTVATAELEDAQAALDVRLMC